MMLTLALLSPGGGQAQVPHMGHLKGELINIFDVGYNVDNNISI